jgi:hypothetical protein
MSDIASEKAIIVDKLGVERSCKEVASLMI